MNTLEQIRKLRALEKGSPFEGERLNAKAKADELEKSVQYEEWMADVSEVIHSKLSEEQSEELLGKLVEKYYKDGYVGNEYYIEFLKEAVGKCFGTHYRAKKQPEWGDITDIDENGDSIYSEDENICLDTFSQVSSLIKGYFVENAISTS